MPSKICDNLKSLTWSAFKTLSYRYFLRIIGLPVKGSEIESTLKLLSSLEERNIKYLSLKKGYKQHENIPTSLKFRVSNMILRGLLAIHLIRCIILIAVKNDQLLIYMGDFLYKSRGKEGLLVNILLIVTAMAILREIVLYLEDKNNLIELKLFHDMIQNGVSSQSIEMIDSQFKIFIRYFHMVLINFLRLISIWNSSVLFVLVMFRLINPWIIENKALLFYSLIWWPVEAYVSIYLFSGAIALWSHLLIYLIIYLYRLNSLIELLTKFSTKMSISSMVINWLNTNLIKFMNDIDKLSHRLRYFFVYLVANLSFAADSYLFLGAILKVHSDLVAKFLFAIGITLLVLNAVIIYASSTFLNHLKTIYGLYLRILRNNSSTKLPVTLKIHEILNRIMGPYNGVKLGDFGSMTREFIVIYLLENACMVMLFTVNLKSLWIDLP